MGLRKRYGGFNGLMPAGGLMGLGIDVVFF